MRVSVSAPTPVTVTVRPVLGKKHQTQKVDHQTQATHPEDQFGIVDVLGLYETFETLHSDRETQGHQEHRIN